MRSALFFEPDPFNYVISQAAAAARCAARQASQCLLLCRASRSQACLQAEKAVSRLSVRQALLINDSRGSATKGKRKGGMAEGEGEGGRREDGKERGRRAALVINQRVDSQID